MPYYPLSGYKIDGFDLYGNWKISVKKITGLLQFLARKGEVSQSWPDSDGEERFITASDIYFEGRDIFMFCYLRASTYTEMMTLLGQFKHRLEIAGARTLTVPYTTTTYQLMYIKGSDIEMLTPKRKSSQYICEFWIQFRETVPTRS